MRESDGLFRDAGDAYGYPDAPYRVGEQAPHSPLREQVQETALVVGLSLLDGDRPKIRIGGRLDRHQGAMADIAIRNLVVSTAHPPSNQALDQTFRREPAVCTGRNRSV